MRLFIIGNNFNQRYWEFFYRTHNGWHKSFAAATGISFVDDHKFGRLPLVDA